MAANYVLLEKITVGAATAASVTFSGIPQTGYTDLVVKASLRNTGSGAGDSSFLVEFNGSSTTYTGKTLYANGSSASSFNETTPSIYGNVVSSWTANTFGNNEVYIPNYTSANYKSFSADGVGEANATRADASLGALLWSNTAAITSIAVKSYASFTFAQYSTFYLYGVAALGTTPVIVPYATGGDTIMTDGSYWYHAFVSSGTFTPLKGLSCDVLTVAGGGGGYQTIGGGAGGYLYSTSQSFSTAQTVTIGAGGGLGTSGVNSSCGSLTATGGGGGAVGVNGVAGGSGSGSFNDNGVGGAGTSGQGNKGGNCGTGNYQGAGGGGAGAAGQNITAPGGGNGGIGSNAQSTFASVTGTGVSGYYAGGGGGGTNSGAGTGGTGGGGAGSTTNATAGTANTGGGGGGGWGSAAAGGSGIVIVRYAV